MRRIVKTHAPQELLEWREENKDFNHSYNDLSCTGAHRVLKEKLLEEQGKLCAYTGTSIETKTSHIEHLKPQNKCNEWEDVDYRNVVVCFPLDGGDKSLGYGAPMKGGWWDESKFISPLSDDCERRFKFAWSGRIHPHPIDHEAAIETISLLGLNNKKLQLLRKARIDGFFGFGKQTQSKPLSIADAKTALLHVDKFSHGKLTEFCFVLKQLLPKYINKGKIDD
jgi:uncharacterized protein (TIGR02646 family)